MRYIQIWNPNWWTITIRSQVWGISWHIGTRFYTKQWLISCRGRLFICSQRIGCLPLLCASRACLTNGFLIEFEIITLGVLWLMIYWADHNAILHKPRQCRDVFVQISGVLCKPHDYKFGRILNSIKMSLVGRTLACDEPVLAHISPSWTYTFTRRVKSNNSLTMLNQAPCPFRL